jgi:hypothetical protein
MTATHPSMVTTECILLPLTEAPSKIFMEHHLAMGSRQGKMIREAHCTHRNSIQLPLRIDLLVLQQQVLLNTLHTMDKNQAGSSTRRRLLMPLKSILMTLSKLQQISPALVEATPAREIKLRIVLEALRDLIESHPEHVGKVQ